MNLILSVAYAGDQITTARQFVEEIATGSSLSGRPYEIRRADGTTVKSGESLIERLEAMEREATEEKSPAI